MNSLVEVVAGGIATALLLTAATSAAPLVLGDEAMSQMRTSYRLVEPEQAAIQSGIQGEASVTLTAVRSSHAHASAVGTFRPAARPDRKVHRIVHKMRSAAAAPRVAIGPAGAPTRTLSDSEADQVTAAGFLFPVAAAINVRAIVARPPMVFTPVARMTSFMRDVVVVPRPSPSMIVEIGRL